MRLRAGEGRGARCQQKYDTGSCYTVLQSTGDPDGREPLHSGGGRLVRRLYIRGAARQEDPVPSAESCTTAGVDHRASRHAVLRGHAARVRGRARPHAAARAAPARARRALHAVCAGHARGRASTRTDAGIRPDEAYIGSGRAGPPVPGGRPAPLPLVHVQVLLQRAPGRAPLLARPGARRAARLPRRMGTQAHLRAPGQRGDTQVHSRTAANVEGPALHQPAVRGVQELRKCCLHGRRCLR
uniref:SFRICE_018564 n=1 Tax=Spodoptera frugiperda TaxID=7108 RepID=A0A2H1VX45_SPOFR